MSAISLKRKHKNRISASERWRQWAVVLADVTCYPSRAFIEKGNFDKIEKRFTFRIEAAASSQLSTVLSFQGAPYNALLFLKLWVHNILCPQGNRANIAYLKLILCIMCILIALPVIEFFHQ